MNKQQAIFYARELRKNPTPAESLLWIGLRKNKAKGCKFLRQHPILYAEDRGELFFFIVDFCCMKKMIIIEVDGEIHNFQRNKDENRQQILEDIGFFVIRFSNEEVLKNPSGVLRRIRSLL